MTPITVVLGSPDAHLRAAVRAVLTRAGARITGEACDRPNTGALVRETVADVAVVDVSLLSIREFFLTGWGPVSRATRIVVVGPADAVLERHFRAQGAAAYVPRERLDDDLPAALDRAAGRNGGHGSVVSMKA